MDTLYTAGSDGALHRVPAGEADKFYHGSDGRPLTDAEYDEHQRRLAAAEALGDAVTWEVLK